ncbi:hypothetical protein LIER_23542 [Lithospermum erythrorhizon]|uniref:Uncharacterized protein n=1 Tax=Lithospermum erythrorhizon TaxID=34254 RepID=A0AAV3R3L0_LITER
MASTNTIIDVRNRKISMSMLDQTVNISIFNSWLSNCVNDCLVVDELNVDTFEVDVARKKEELELMPTLINCSDTGQTDKELKKKLELKKIVKRDIDVPKQQAYYPRPFNEQYLRSSAGQNVSSRDLQMKN